MVVDHNLMMEEIVAVVAVVETNMMDSVTVDHSCLLEAVVTAWKLVVDY